MPETVKNIQQALVLIKPDGLKKSLTGNILTKLSEAKMVIIGAKMVVVSKELAEEHYRQLSDQPFFNELVRYLRGELHGKPYNRVFALVYQGDNAIKQLRAIAGATNPEQADPISIRGAYGRILTSGLYENVIHCSSDPAEAEREIKLWFKPEDIVGSIYPTKKTILKNVEVTVWE
ncbi:MAG: nucleoside-diphosphate kinase [Elusimicrobia bacterium]|nr:nucleoside-diphosphate kinase [Candidatus Liberimonas magnetica]